VIEDIGYLWENNNGHILLKETLARFGVSGICANTTRSSRRQIFFKYPAKRVLID